MQVRTVATPLTIAFFITTGLTGVALLFGYHGGWVGLLHKVASVVFVIGSVLHVAVNLKPTLRHLRRPLGAALATFCLLAAVLGMWPRGGQAGNLRQTLQRAGDVLLDLTPGELATATRQPREVVADRIRAAGFQVPDGDATLRAIAIWNHRPAFQILAVATSPAGARS